ncbi:MAG: serine hydrolase domain-containing protein [Bdellovibrionia bacterium]
MKNALRSTLAVVTISLVSHVAFAKSNDTTCSTLQKSLQQINSQVFAEIEKLRQAEGISAVTYTVFNDSCFLTIGESGAPSFNEKNVYPLSAENSIFRLNSVSKVFVTMAMSQLIEKGIIHPDSSLLDLHRAKFVNFITSKLPLQIQKKWAKIKVRHLMNHQAGISKDIPGSLVFYNTESLANNSYPTLEALYFGLPYVEFLFEPGKLSTSVKYSNLAMNLLGRIVEDYNPEGLTYEEYVAKNILRPLGMNKTFMNIPSRVEPLMVRGYGAKLTDGQRTPIPKALFAGSYEGSIGLASTATDLAKMGAELLRITNNRGTLLKNKAVVDYYMMPTTLVGQNFVFAHGPAWQVIAGETFADTVWFGHSGSGSGERSVLLVSPERNVGVTVLMSATDAPRDKFVKILSDAYKNLKYSPSKEVVELHQHVRQVLEQTPTIAVNTPPSKTPQQELEKFVGDYFTDVIGVQKISLSDDGHLVFYGQKLQVVDAKRGLFRFPEMPGLGGLLFNREPIIFKMNEQGQVQSATVANVKIYTKIK